MLKVCDWDHCFIFSSCTIYRVQPHINDWYRGGDFLSGSGELHLWVKDNLMNDVIQSIKNWQKDNYHKQLMRIHPSTHVCLELTRPGTGVPVHYFPTTAGAGWCTPAGGKENSEGEALLIRWVEYIWYLHVKVGGMLHGYSPVNIYSWRISLQSNRDSRVLGTPRASTDCLGNVWLLHYHVQPTHHSVGLIFLFFIAGTDRSVTELRRTRR